MSSPSPGKRRMDTDVIKLYPNAFFYDLNVLERDRFFMTEYCCYAIKALCTYWFVFFLSLTVLFQHRKQARSDNPRWTE